MKKETNRNGDTNYRINKSENQYRKIYRWGNHERPITTEKGISHISTKDRSHPDGANPIGDILSGGDCALTELFCQINNSKIFHRKPCVQTSRTLIFNKYY